MCSLSLTLLVLPRPLSLTLHPLKLLNSPLAALRVNMRAPLPRCRRPE
jgi:hypothetical protein